MKEIEWNPMVFADEEGNIPDNIKIYRIRGNRPTSAINVTLPFADVSMYPSKFEDNSVDDTTIYRYRLVKPTYYDDYEPPVVVDNGVTADNSIDSFTFTIET